VLDPVPAPGVLVVPDGEDGGAEGPGGAADGEADGRGAGAVRGGSVACASARPATKANGTADGESQPPSERKGSESRRISAPLVSGGPYGATF